VLLSLTINNYIMKKIASLLVLLILSAQLNAQMYSKKIKGNGDITTSKRTVSNFTKIGVAGSFHVTLSKENISTIVIKADENLLEYILTEIENGELIIKTKKGFQIHSTKNIEIRVPFQKLEDVSLAGSGNITSDDAIDSPNLKLSVAGSGDLNLKVQTKNLNSSIAGSGNIYLNGTTNELTCSIAGSGNVYAYDLKSDITTLKIAGSGNAKVNASKEIHGSTVGSGNIYYSGNPPVVKVKSSGSGSVKSKG